MQILRLSLVVCAAALAAVPAWAQYGLYGSPELLPFSQLQPAAYAAPSAVNAAQMAVPQPRPGPVLAPPGPAYGRPYVDAVAAEAAVPKPAPAAAPVLAPSLMEPDPAAAVPKQSPSVVQQMLNDPAACGGTYPSTGCQGCGDGCSPSKWDLFCRAMRGQDGDGCTCGNCCRSPWFGYVGAVIMSRDQPNRVWTSYQFSEDGRYDTMQLTNTNDVGVQWKWGVEVRFGRRFCCDRWAVEATYWTLDAFSGFHQCFPVYYNELAPPNRLGLGTPLQFQQVFFDGETAENWFGNGAREHRLWRRNEFHNVEVNLIRNRLFGDCNSAFAVDWLAGARFFRFEETLTFASLRNGYYWGQPNGEAYLKDEVANNLWGFQLGFNADWWWAHNLRLFAAPKFGIYNNHIDQTFRIWRGDGVVGSGVYGNFPASGTRDSLSFLTQIDLGLDWQFAQNWSARLGYRVVAATGMALADHQFPQYMVDIPEINSIHNNGNLILHGAFMGITYNY